MQRVIPIESPLFIAGSSVDELPDWHAVFGNQNPLVLEIGCGIGDFVVAMASRSPGLNFIALDYYNKGCLKSCRRAERAGLSNVRIIRDEARSFITRCLPLDSLSAVYINCPDPWPKRYQRKRRLVGPQFVRFLTPYLVTGGVFSFSTDFDDYGIDVADIMKRQEGFENILAPDTYRHDIEGFPRTKYMLKFMAEGKDIYFVQYRKTQTG